MPMTRSATTLAIALVLCSLTPVSASQVGIKTFLVQDTTRKDTLKPRLTRSWDVDLYYPTDSASMRKPPYLEDDVILKKLEADKYYGISRSALESWGTKPGPAIRNAPQLTNERRPLVIILPGMGTIRANYAILASKFVNRGFVVAVIDLPYLGLQRLPDGRILQADDDPLATSEDPAAYAPRIREFTKDVSVTINHLRSRLVFDPKRIIVTGHSSGGTVAVDVCGEDARVLVCINFEGGIEPTELVTRGASKPTLIVASRAKGRPETPFNPEKPDSFEKMRLAMGANGNDSSWIVKITGGSHMSYSDFSEVFPYAISQFGGEVMTSERTFELYPGIVAAFANAYGPQGHGNREFEDYLSKQPEVTRSAHSGPGRGVK
ncbi:MAG TPA: alpha/beta fold hydrolase [Acidobacteriaceae bacterium]|nr:alpha/beta fold hydrolase [Acidobacteriaceae bacterium]